MRSADALSEDRLGARFFGLLVLLSGLGAYAIGPVPVQWLALLFAPLFVVVVAFRGGLFALPGGAWAIWYCGWLTLVAITRLPWRAAYPMPPLASTPYLIFILLRIAELVGFLAILFGVYALLRRGGRERVFRTVSGIGTLIAAVAIYIYFAQIYGLPEPTRTRLGTGGLEGQSVVFTYAFHRALGTFREPSHLAEWLIVPLMMSVARAGRWFNVRTGVMAVALLLTGSLTGLVGLALGAAGGALLLGLLRREVLRNVIALVLVAAVALQLFSLVVRGYEGEMDIHLATVVVDRIAPILEGGMTQSNRGAIYEYIDDHPIPLWGHGPGNANLALSAAIGEGAMSSHLSLYLATVYAGGIVAVLILLAFLALPVGLTLVHRGVRERAEYYPLLTAYLAWIVMFAVHSETLSFMFAVIYAAVMSEVTRADCGWLGRTWQEGRSLAVGEA